MSRISLRLARLAFLTLALSILAPVTASAAKNPPAFVPVPPVLVNPGEPGARIGNHEGGVAFLRFFARYLILFP